MKKKYKREENGPKLTWIDEKQKERNQDHWEIKLV